MFNMLLTQFVRLFAASNAWLVHLKENRLLLFDGTAMHSAIPGDQQANPKAGRRVTFMCVFWPKGGFCASEVRSAQSELIFYSQN